LTKMTWAMKTRDLLRQGREEGYREGFEEGYREGLEETFEEAIRAFVVIAKKLSIEQEVVVQNLVENFGQSPEDAEKKMKLYWGK
jgi:flagellar biosynthesis/type III secretory pathway protein FliH